MWTKGNMRSRAVAGSLLSSLAAAFSMVGPALAQVAAPVPVPDLTQPASAPELQSVMLRPRPEYDALPIRVDSYSILPTIDVGERYDSNIFGTPGHDTADFITFLRPAVAITSDWGGDDQISLFGSGDIEHYAANTDNDVANLALEADGRLYVVNGEYFELRSGYQINHESRFAPDSEESALLAGGGFFAKDPTQYEVAEGTLSFVRSRGLLGFGIDADITNYAFSNEPTLNGGLAINSDRNRNVYTLTPRVSYEIVPGYQAFVQASGDRTQYDEIADATPDHLKRSSNGYAFAAGTQVDLGDIVTGSIYLGYRANTYQDPRLPEVEGPYFGATALWNVTDNTSLTLNTSRTIEETILIGSPGAWYTLVDAGVQRELTYSVIATGDLSYAQTEYEGINRTDNLYTLSGGGKWLINRYLTFNATAGYERRNSNADNSGLSDATLSIGLKAAF